MGHGSLLWGGRILVDSARLTSYIGLAPHPRKTKSPFFILAGAVKYTIGLTGMMEFVSSSKFIAGATLTRPSLWLHCLNCHCEKSTALAAFALLGFAFGWQGLELRQEQSSEDLTSK